MFRILLLVLFMLTGCNSVYLKPNTMEPNTKVYFADRGGYTMRRSMKQAMEERGYNVVVGQAVATNRESDGDTNIRFRSSKVPADTRYFVEIDEKQEKFQPMWCVFNGFWWWRFNVSIADQQTGQEIMTWRGRGCVNSTLRRLDKILDKLEKTDDLNN